LGARRLDKLHLLEIGLGDLAKANGRDEKLISARAGGDQAAVRASNGSAASDQFFGGRPIQTHIALRGIHGLGDAQPVAEQVTPEREGGVPVNDCWRTGNVLTAWVGHHMSRRKGGPALEGLGMLSPRSWLAEFDLPPAAAGIGQRNGGGSRRHEVNQSIATRRPSADDVRPASASCKPRTPAARREGCGRLASTSERKCSHWARNPLGNSALSGICSHWLRKSSVVRRSGFHTGIGVLTRGWLRQPNRPPAAEPWVPSTWNSTSSPRSTRTAHDELIWAITSSSISKIAYAVSSAVA